MDNLSDRSGFEEEERAVAIITNPNRFERNKEHARIPNSSVR
jgi:hypothetical protein